MEEIKKKKNKRTILFVVIPLILVVIGVLVVMHIIKKTDEDLKKNTLPDNDKVMNIEKREIVNSISGTGKLVSKNSESPSSDGIGMEITAVHVSEGDVVKSGDLIATLDPSEMIEQRNELSKRISDIRSTQSSYHSELDKATQRSNESKLNRLYELNQSLAEAEAEYNEANAELLNSEQEYEKIKDSEGYVDQLRASQLQFTIETQKTNVNTLKSEVDSIKESIDAIENPEENLFDTDRTVKQYDDGINDSVNALQDQIKEINKRIDGANIYATMDGTVTSVSAKVGNTYYGQGICTIEGVDDFIVEAEIDEYNIPDVRVDQKVYMKTEATRDEELLGKVVFVSPKAGGSSGGGMSDILSSLSGGDDLSSMMGGMNALGGGDLSSMIGGSSGASYLVKISMDSKNERLRLGMNVKISIVTEEVKDALSVPYDAVRERDDGSKYVKIIEGYDPDREYEDGEEPDYKISEIDVEVGMEGTYYVEIISSEIKEGMQVLVPTGEENSTVDDLLNMMGSAAGS